MILFKNVRAKNILSYGNEFTNISLNSDSKTLIIGSNGSGKSSIIEFIIFALYNKPFRKITKPQLVNSITKKGLLVELEFDIGANSYLIRRGIKPNVFEIFENSVLLNQPGDSKDYQQVLENQILKKSYKTFLQIDILGSSRYSAFMELTTGERRSVIEDLLDLQIFSAMNVICKQKIQENNDEIRDNEDQYKSLNSKLNLFKESQKETVDFYQKEIESRNFDLKDTQDQIVKLTTQQSDLKFQDVNNPIKDTRDLKLQERDLVQRLTRLSTSIEALKSDITFFMKNDNCPTCKQKIDELFRDQTCQEKQAQLEKNQQYQEIGQKKLKTIEGDISDIETQINQRNSLKREYDSLTNKIAILESNEISVRRKIRDLEDKRNSLSIQKKNDEELIAVDIQRINRTLEFLKQDKQNLNLILNSLKDSGVKARIISEYIPLINQRINHYLDKMNFMVSFELSENFEETVKSRHRDIFSYNSFSEGQKGRLNLAILFAFRDIAKARNSVSSNLLIMDEILDSSLDDTGIDDFMNLLDSVKNTNVIIISHRPDNISDKFDRILQFNLKKNFTHMDVF